MTWRTGPGNEGWGYSAAPHTHTTHTPGHTPPGPLQDMRALLAHGAHPPCQPCARGSTPTHERGLPAQPGPRAGRTRRRVVRGPHVTCNAHTRDSGRERRERYSAGRRRGRLSGVEKQPPPPCTAAAPPAHGLASPGCASLHWIRNPRLPLADPPRTSSQNRTNCHTSPPSLGATTLVSTTIGSHACALGR